MLPLRAPELPQEKEALLRKAVYAEWATIGFMLSIVLAMYLTLGSSQAMRTAWFEDILSLIPPIAFLISMRIARRPPNQYYPYGYHRAVTIAFLCGAVAVFGVGILLFVESAKTLFAREHPTIGAVTVFGHTLWLGWFMFAALLYSAIPPVLLGRYKAKLARQTHDKTLFADASMNRADWLTALAAILGVGGVGLGFWWADATAACIISVDIARDGFGHLKTAVADLMNRRVKTVDGEEIEQLPDDIVQLLKDLPWVADAAVRLRDEGHLFLGEAFIVPASGDDLTQRIADASTKIHQLDWRMHEITIMPVNKIERAEDEAPESS